MALRRRIEWLTRISQGGHCDLFPLWWFAPDTVFTSAVSGVFYLARSTITSHNASVILF
nr:MAG TPA: hypothetical protein [Caudoviricetes sp.]